MKDECAGTPIAEFVGLRPKMYSILKSDEKNIKKAKGVKKNVVKKQITHENYKETLFGAKQQWHGMNILRSEGHEIYGMHINKISLSPFDSKRWIGDDGIHTKAYGYTCMDIFSTLTDDELRVLEAEVFKVALGVTVCSEGQPAVLHEQSRAWARRADSRERVVPVWKKIFQCRKLSKTRLDPWLFSRPLQARRAGRDNELGQKRGGFFRFFQQASCKVSTALHKQIFL